MLTISDKEYLMPIREVQDDGTVIWHIERKSGNWEVISSKHFQYTIHVTKVLPEIHHLTFVYDGRSVKPAPRTLRLLGSQMAEKFTAKLANNEKRVIIYQAMKSNGLYELYWPEVQDEGDIIL
jgi:hypothetical protein